MAIHAILTLRLIGSPIVDVLIDLRGRFTQLDLIRRFDDARINFAKGNLLLAPNVGIEVSRFPFSFVPLPCSLLFLFLVFFLFPPYFESSFSPFSMLLSVSFYFLLLGLYSAFFSMGSVNELLIFRPNICPPKLVSRSSDLL